MHDFSKIIHVLMKMHLSQNDVSRSATNAFACSLGCGRSATKAFACALSCGLCWGPVRSNSRWHCDMMLSSWAVQQYNSSSNRADQSVDQLADKDVRLGNQCEGITDNPLVVCSFQAKMSTSGERFCSCSRQWSVQMITFTVTFTV